MVLAFRLSIGDGFFDYFDWGVYRFASALSVNCRILCFSNTSELTLDHMKSFLTATAIIEAVTGLALATVPASVAQGLLGTALTEPGGVLIARLAGAALLTIAIACWFSRNDTHSSAMAKVMLAYNVFAITLLVYAAVIEQVSGRGLWPAVLLHAVLLIWCLSMLRKQAV
jgi:hypothetical protein